MSVRNVIHCDFLTLFRSYFAQVLLISVAGLLGTVFVLAVVNTPARATTIGLITTSFVAMLSIPLVCLAAGVFAVAGERESGTIRVLLGFPNTRLEVVTGKALSRAGLVATSLLIGFLAVSLAASVLTAAPNFGSIGLLTLWTILLATSYIGLTVGISAATTTHMRAIVGSTSAYLFWSILWLPMFPISVSGLTIDLLEQILPTKLSPSAVAMIEALNPLIAYGQGLQILGPAFENIARSYSSVNTLVNPLLALGILSAWSVCPLAFGYIIFNRTPVE